MSLKELPKAEMILPGLSDLHRGESKTIGALLVAIAATRSTEAGANLSARLQDEREDAYLYYNALLNRLNSFCNALELSYKYKPSDNALEPTKAKAIFKSQ